METNYYIKLVDLDGVSSQRTISKEKIINIQAAIDIKRKTESVTTTATNITFTHNNVLPNVKPASQIIIPPPTSNNQYK